MRKANNQSGFSLLEVVITLAILVTMIYAVSMLMRASFDVRRELSQEAKVTHRLNVALQRIAYDLAHTFVIDSRVAARNNLTQSGRRTVFKVERGEKGDKLAMTYMGHRPRHAHSKESDVSYVVYEVRSSKNSDHPGRTHLYRGEYPRIPDDVRRVEDPKMQPFVEHISSITFDLWNGDDWVKGRWDTTRSETNNHLPHMVRVTIKAWLDEPIEGVGSDSSQDPMAQFATVVYLPMSLDFNEIKSRTSSFNLKATE